MPHHAGSIVALAPRPAGSETADGSRYLIDALKVLLEAAPSAGASKPTVQ